MNLKKFSISIIVILLLGLIVYRIFSNVEEESKNNDKGGKKSPMAVNAIVISEMDYANTISLSGTIEANETVEIRSEVSGVVEKIYFTEGTNVSKGQVLVKVNDIELRAQLSQAQTRQSLASENERRAKLLLQKEAISQEEYDIASAEFRSLKAQTQLIQAQIAKTTIRAPFSGKIGLRNISPGTYVTPSLLITNLVNTNQLKITFSIPEKYAAKVQVNSIIKFKVAGTSEEFEAKIYAIEPSIDITTRTLQVRAATENKNNSLFPGTYANVELPLDVVKNAILIPTEAIIPIQNGKKVYVAVNNMATERMIKTDTRTENNVLVIEGLKKGDTLITSGIMSLKTDTPVKVTLQ
jgi:membrane fusion protein, multidrug efflux system